eukprot:3289637-Alexandrium_andersonii.AAC.1
MAARTTGGDGGGGRRPQRRASDAPKAFDADASGDAAMVGGSLRRHLSTASSRSVVGFAVCGRRRCASRH